MMTNAESYTDQHSPISRGNYGDLRIRAKNLLRDPKRTVAEVESLIALEALPLLRVRQQDKPEHAGDIALQVMSDVIAKLPERADEWTFHNGEEIPIR
jgi:hypothetical protein